MWKEVEGKARERLDWTGPNDMQVLYGLLVCVRPCFDNFSFFKCHVATL